MKTNGTTDAVLPLTRKQKCVCNVVMGVLLVAAGIILVLAGTDVIHASVRKIAAPTILFGFGVAVLFSAIVAKNSLSMWLAGVILACGLTSLLEVTTTATYGNLFPIYIASPGIGCLFAIWFAEAKFPQVKAMIFFGGFAVLFSLASSGACGWGLTGGLIAAFGGLLVIAYAAGVYFGKDKEDDA
ncbi:MAG: hypothetical protein J1G01_06035 [Clostridiales bacterium]|nr:hypothetical protein [Clostridiales bacterium]